MALCRHTYQDTTRPYTSRFLSLLALILAALAAAGCASAATQVPPTATPPPTNTPTPTNTPAPEMDAGEHVLEAVQKPNLITVVDTTIVYLNQAGEEWQQETGRAWLDFPGQRVRIEGWLNGQPSTISVVEGGTKVEYSRDRNQIDEHPVRFFGMSLEEARDTLPPHLSNPALLGLVPLAGALLHAQGEIRPAGDGQWEDRPATLWETDFAGGPEGFIHTYTTIYLEPDNFQPLGQEVRYTSSEDQAPELSEFVMSVTYQLDFVSLEDAPRGVYTPGRIFHPDEPEPTPFLTAGPPPPPLPAVPASDLPPAAAESSLLRVMEKLPASFGEKGVWFADYARAWEMAGLPPRPNNLEDFLALSEEEREAYGAAHRGLMFGPHLLMVARSYAQGWEELFGFSALAVSLAVGTGHGHIDPFFTTAYLEADLEAEDTRQRLLDLGYREETVSGGTYYAIRGDRDQDIQSPITRKAGVMAQMNRVFLAEGVLAASPDTDPIVDVVAASSRDTSVLVDDPVSSRLAASLGQPLSATLLPRFAVLEPVGWPELSYDTYERPEDWGTIHQWEALAAGFTRVDGAPWWAISLFCSDPEAAEADAGEVVERMNSYRTAITALMYPSMSGEGLAAAAQVPYPISESCASLTPVHTRDDAGSVLTVWCEVGGQSSILWLRLMEWRDLGFLLP